MRGAYLKPCGSDRHSGSRGGVGSGDNGTDYELEIGQSQNASCDMLAHCVLIDEIHEFLRKTDTPLARMILQQHRQVVKGLEDGLEQARQAERAKDFGQESHELTLAALAEKFGPDALDKELLQDGPLQTPRP